MYDAVVASADYLSKNAKRPKQVLLIITDGEDNASSATLEQAIRRVQDLDGPAIYCDRAAVWGGHGPARVAACARGAARARRADGRAGLFPEVAEGSGRDRGGGRAGHPHAVHHRVPLDEVAELGRVPAGACGGQGKGLPRAAGADADRLLPANGIATRRVPTDRHSRLSPEVNRSGHGNRKTVKAGECELEAT